MKNHNILPYTKAARELSRSLRGKMTSSEKIVWTSIRKKQLGIEFLRQFPILDYVVDFYAKEIGLAIEIDGEYHENQFLEDAERQGRIESLGVHFIRFTNDKILNETDGVIEELTLKINEIIK